MIVSRRDVLRLSGLGAAGVVLSACGAGSSTPAPAAAQGGFGEISVQLSWIKNIEFGGEKLVPSNDEVTLGRQSLLVTCRRQLDHFLKHLDALPKEFFELG